MHLGRWFSETAFDSFDYLVPAVLLFVLAATKWAWRYWRRESLPARRIVLNVLLFPFEATKEAWAYLETGRAKGKVVIKVRRRHK